VKDEFVLVSTHDLKRAGALRDGFQAAGYGTDLVTPDEDIAGRDGVVLLVLTGGLEDRGGALAEQARGALNVPVLGISAGDTLLPALRPGFDEVFGRATSLDDIVLVGRTVVERRRLQRITGIVGETDAMHEVLERVVQIAPVAATVLVTGESGTGKELVARGLHALSPRRYKPFISVNVAALSDTLLESELFGHEKGAFTGAIDARRGLFELAHGGTIFLDEIGEMPLTTQTKLLRVLEQREFLRVGGEKLIQVDVRIVAATNQDLRQLVAIGEFRRDLYYRFNVLSIALPPLRQRRDDIPLLVQEFVEEASSRHDRPFPGISPEAMEILRDYAWPGNVRELRNLVESMVVLSPGRVIQPGDIPDEVRAGRSGTLLPAPIPRPFSGSVAKQDLRPELEFVFRTLVDLRLDVDDLRREFEVYRREGPVTGIGRRYFVGGADARDVIARPVEAFSSDEPDEEDATAAPSSDVPGSRTPPQDEQGVVVFRPGMTMEDLEREAIAAALASVAGNRRKAAELLQIGERTLYRKISKYGLET
jgi:transcriptional regulator with PAS, ATPase and Fis domain